MACTSPCPQHTVAERRRALGFVRQRSAQPAGTRTVRRRGELAPAAVRCRSRCAAAQAVASGAGSGRTSWIGVGAASRQRSSNETVGVAVGARSSGAPVGASRPVGSSGQTGATSTTTRTSGPAPRHLSRTCDGPCAEITICTESSFTFVPASGRQCRPWMMRPHFSFPSLPHASRAPAPRRSPARRSHRPSASRVEPKRQVPVEGSARLLTDASVSPGPSGAPSSSMQPMSPVSPDWSPRGCGIACANERRRCHLPRPRRGRCPMKPLVHGLRWSPPPQPSRPAQIPSSVGCLEVCGVTPAPSPAHRRGKRVRLASRLHWSLGQSAPLAVRFVTGARLADETCTASMCG
jgi:hypothetical protein